MRRELEWVRARAELATELDVQRAELDGERAYFASVLANERVKYSVVEHLLFKFIT